MRNNDVNETISIFIKHLDPPKKKSLANARAMVLVAETIT
jgi:hypothetical protein